MSKDETIKKNISLAFDLLGEIIKNPALGEQIPKMPIPINVFEIDYFKKHIPHRINLLITFRERFSPKKSNLKPEELRDFFRCSKDISMLMVRFLLNELGIYLPKKELNKEDDIQKGTDKEFKQRIKYLDIESLTIDEVKRDKLRYKNILDVLKAANRAVAHIEKDDVFHEIETDIDHPILIDSINFTEEMIKQKMYVKTRRNYEEIMAFCYNDMQRKTKKVNIIVS